MFAIVSFGSESGFATLPVGQHRRQFRQHVLHDMNLQPVLRYLTGRRTLDPILSRD
jgi:hypothetical protein